MRESVKKHKWDIIVVSAILLVGIISLILVLTLRREGGSVVVVINNAELGEYSLDKDATYELYGVIPEGDERYENAKNNPTEKKIVTHILIIEDGVAYIEEATCKGQQCVKKGKIKYVGQHIICAYHDVRVSVTGATEGGVDLVS